MARSENGGKAQPHLIYRADTALRIYTERDGQACYFVGKTPRADDPCKGIAGHATQPLYDVEFDDGAIMPVFGNELHIP